ncbi:MAG: DUF4062 domain-containing protein [Treponematales bacterium]
MAAAKYHVFLSSSLDDLKAERRELEKLIIELGAVPSGSELFDWGDETGRGVIKKTIREADYFVSLAAHRRGAVTGTASAPELEYHYARKCGVPVIALVIDEKARRKAGKKESDAGEARALEAFKRRLLGGVYETWLNIADLTGKARLLLTREMNLNPRPGWVRGGDAARPEVANELARLLAENEALKRLLRTGGTDAASATGQARHALKVLAANKISLSFYYDAGKNWENTQEFRYLALYRLLAPELVHRKSAAEVSRFLGNILNPDLTRKVRGNFPVPSNTVKKALADFGLLKLVRCAAENEGNEAWELTGFGQEVFAVHRLRVLERALKKKAAIETALETKGEAAGE